MRVAACLLVSFVALAALRVAQPAPAFASEGVAAGVSQQPAPQAPATQPTAGQQVPPGPDRPPTESALGLGPGGIYPGAQFLTSYDAGQGQRYYLFGVTTPFEEVVTYYRGVLKDKGDRVFDEPAVHQFDIGKYREETMAFPPSITVKDYTWGGMGGYLNPKPGAQPQRFKTIIQIVPMPSATPVQPRR
jgi:hypothetical protein